MEFLSSALDLYAGNIIESQVSSVEWTLIINIVFIFATSFNFNLDISLALTIFPSSDTKNAGQITLLSVHTCNQQQVMSICSIVLIYF